MKPFILSLLLLLLLLLVSCTPAEDVVRIGALYPQTGPVAVAGEFVAEGIVMAQADLKGRSLEIIVEDDACTAKGGVTGFEKLATVDRVPLVIGPFCSSAAIAAAPIANANEVVLLSSGAATPLLSVAGPYTFRVSPSDVHQVRFMSAVLEQFASVAVLYVQDQQPADMAQEFIAFYPGAISVVESFESDATDVRAQLLKIKNSNVDALFVIVFPAQYPLVTQEIVEIGLDVPLYATHTFETGTSLQMGELANLYTYSIQQYDKDGAADFVVRFTERFGHTPSVWSVFTYDAVMLAADAIEECGNDGVCAREYLVAVEEYEGVSGKITFDVNGDITEPSYALKTVRDGKFVEKN